MVISQIHLNITFSDEYAFGLLIKKIGDFLPKQYLEKLLNECYIELLYIVSNEAKRRNNPELLSLITRKSNPYTQLITEWKGNRDKLIEAQQTVEPIEYIWFQVLQIGAINQQHKLIKEIYCPEIASNFKNIAVGLSGNIMSNLSLIPTKYNGLSQYLITMKGLPDYSDNKITLPQLAQRLNIQLSNSDNLMVQIKEIESKGNIKLIVLNKRISGQTIQFRNIGISGNKLQDMNRQKAELIAQLKIPSNDNQRKIRIQAEVYELTRQIDASKTSIFKQIESINEAQINQNRPIYYSPEGTLFQNNQLLIFSGEYSINSNYVVLWYLGGNYFQISPIVDKFEKLPNANGLFRLIKDKFPFGQRNFVEPKPKHNIFNINRPYYMLYQMFKQYNINFTRISEIKISNTITLTFEPNDDKEARLRKLFNEYFNVLKNKYEPLISEIRDRISEVCDNYPSKCIEKLPSDYPNKINNDAIVFYKESCINLIRNSIDNTPLTEMSSININIPAGSMTIFLNRLNDGIEVIIQELADFLFLQISFIKVNNKIPEKDDKEKLIAEILALQNKL